jgi:ABC-type sulfate/molybdate transport systems ATPase subunit
MGEQEIIRRKMSFLEVRHVTKRNGETTILKDINFDLRRSERLAVAGETGSGKSTLLKIIAGLGQADEGEVIFEGERVAGANEKLVPGHPRIAYLSQHFELPRFLRVEQVLSYSNSLGDKEAGQLYEVCQIDHLQGRKTDQLSGGERQRIALARNLISNPGLLLLDEPFSNLDVIHRNTLKEVLASLSDELEITIILVSHDADDSLPWADTVMVMKDGVIVQKGSPRDIYADPVDEYVAGLFGRYNTLGEEISKTLGLESSSKILRPEKFFLSREGTGIPVSVKSVKFFGAFFEAEVECMSGQKFFVHLIRNDFSEGESALLKLSIN